MISLKHNFILPGLIKLILYLYQIMQLMKILTGSILSFIFLSLSGLHIYWGFGFKMGHAATIPTKTDGKPVINPAKIDCFIVAAGLLVFSVFVLIRAGLVLITLPGLLFNYGMWAITALFLLRAIGDFNYIGFFKKIKKTRFAQMDTMYYSPLCLVIGILSVILNFIN
jgi:hypothetical protein